MSSTNRLPVHVLLIVAGVLSLFPLYWLFLTSLSPTQYVVRVDGASEWQVYRHIIVPLSRPALAVLAIFTFQRYWNAFIFPLVILRDPAKYPVQVGLATLQGEFNTDYGMLMTGAAVAALPLIAVFFAFQRQFIEGIRIGGVKG